MEPAWCRRGARKRIGWRSSKGLAAAASAAAVALGSFLSASAAARAWFGLGLVERLQGLESATVAFDRARAAYARATAAFAGDDAGLAALLEAAT